MKIQSFEDTMANDAALDFGCLWMHQKLTIGIAEFKYSPR